MGTKRDTLENKHADVPLVIVGSIGLDTIETPAEKMEELLGGSVSYACAAASFFSPVGMVGVVGDDFPDTCVDTYEHFGIDLAGLQHAEGKTFRWSGVYETDMVNRRTRRTELNVFETFSPTLPPAYCDAPFFLLGNISPELQLHVLSQAAHPKFVVADTMDLWINTTREDLLKVISRVDMLTLNDSEARLLAGEHGLIKCARKILDWGPSHVVIKKGEHGAFLVSSDGKMFVMPAYPVEDVQDPTGAGDTFAGGFMGILARGMEVTHQAVRNALLYGAVVASFSVEQFSLNALAQLDKRRIEDRVASMTRMISVG